MVKECKTCKHKSMYAECYPCRNCAENNRSGYEALQDLTKMKTTKAFRSNAGENYTDTAWCPYCNAENSEDIKLGGTDKFSREFDTDEANAKIFECVCFHCGQMFRVDYFKEV